MKNRIYAVYHSLIVEDHEMTFKAYQRANYANFFLGATVVSSIEYGLSSGAVGLALLTLGCFYWMHKAKDEVET